MRCPGAAAGSPDALHILQLLGADDHYVQVTAGGRHCADRCGARLGMRADLLQLPVVTAGRGAYQRGQVWQRNVWGVVVMKGTCETGLGEGFIAARGLRGDVPAWVDFLTQDRELWAAVLDGQHSLL